MNPQDIPASELLASESAGRSLAVIGQVIRVVPIQGADFIQLAMIDCAAAGVWSGVVPVSAQSDDRVLVFLQDAVLPPDPRWAFMERHKWRVRMARFKGVPSECVAIPTLPHESGLSVGTDMTAALGVTKHEKPLPKEMAGIARGNFPTFIPKTDEKNFQRIRDVAQLMNDRAWYVTEKADGTSCTVFNDEYLHVCSRSLELIEGVNLYWRMAHKYALSALPVGLALQFEIVGPGVQGNPMGLEENQIRVFGGYRFLHATDCRLTYAELCEVCEYAQLPMARLIQRGTGALDADTLRKMAEIKYANGKPGEGIVIRAEDSSWSFKSINLLYKD